MAPAGQEGRSGKIEVQPVAVHYGEAEPIQAPEARSEW
jgi:hypothetical protein